MYWGESGVSLQDSNTLRLALLGVLALCILSTQCRPGSQGALSVTCLLRDCMPLYRALGSQGGSILSHPHFTDRTLRPGDAAPPQAAQSGSQDLTPGEDGRFESLAASVNSEPFGWRTRAPATACALGIGPGAAPDLPATLRQCFLAPPASVAHHDGLGLITC